MRKTKYQMYATHISSMTPIRYNERADIPLTMIIVTFPHTFQSNVIKLTKNTVIAPDSVVAASTAPFNDSSVK